MPWYWEGEHRVPPETIIFQKNESEIRMHIIMIIPILTMDMISKSTQVIMVTTVN